MRARITGSQAVAFLSALLILSAPLTLFLTTSAYAASDEPIRIEGNAELRAMASERGWAGAGTKASPILINDIDISAADGPLIALIGTDLFVRISDLDLANHSGGPGISLVRASNVQIDNSTLNNLDIAVSLLSCQYITVRDSVISNCTWGIKTVDSRNCQFLSSIYHRNQLSIEMVTSASCLVEKNTFRHNLTQNPIVLRSSSGNSFLTNTLIGGGQGIEVTDGRDNLLRSNSLADMMTGIVLGDLSKGSTLRQNTLANMSRDAIEVRNSTSNRFYSNAMTGCSIHIMGDRAAFNTQTIPENNTVNGRPVVYLKGLVDPPPLSTRTVGQLILGDVKGLTVNKYIVSNGSLGMCLGYCERVTISNCTLTGNDRGIWSYACDDLVFSKNVFVANQIGLYMVDCDDCSSLDETHSKGGNGIVMEGGSCHEVRGASMDQMSLTGIRVHESYDCVIHDCLISSTDIGIWLLSSPRSSVHENQFDGCRIGVMVEGNGTAEINGNLHQDCWEGTRVQNSTGVVVLGGAYQEGEVAIILDNSTATIVDCMVQDAVYGMVLNNTNDTNVLNCHLTGTKEVGILVLGGTDVGLNSNHLWNASQGIRLEATAGANLSSNRCEDLSGDAIILVESVASLLMDNQVARCFHGVYIIGGGGHRVQGNNLSSCYDGLMLYGSSGNIIENNQQLSNSRYGIVLMSSQDNIISSNNLSSNLDKGICLIGSDGNQVVGNDLVRNAGSGIIVLSGSSNQFFDNAFFSNNGAGENYTSSRAQASDHGSGNVWYLDGNGPRGNFWSDLTGPDGNNDGILDVPYLVAGTAASSDPYPLGYPAITTPEAPQHLNGLGRNGRAWIDWEAPQQDGHSPILNYTLYRAVGDGAMSPYAYLDGDVTEFMDQGVVDGQTYRYEVRASNILGEGEASAPLTIMPVDGPMVAHGNDELRDLAHALGWSGDGTAASPYRASDVVVGGAPGESILSLVGTDLYLVLENITFHRFTDGEAISLFRVSNLVMSNCSFLSGGTALDLIACQKIDVRGCLFQGNDMAVRYRLVTASALTDCHFLNNNASLIMQSSSDNQVERCMVELMPGLVGITLASSSSSLFMDNQVKGGEVGIEMTSCQDNQLIGNQLSGQTTGMVINDLCSGTTLQANLFHDILGDGLWIKNATGTSMSNNTFQGCSVAITGDERSFSDNVIFSNNTVNGEAMVYLNQADDGTTISDLVVGQLIIGGARGVVVENLTVLAGGSLGFCIGYSPSLVVKDCTLTDVDRGIYLKGCQEAVLQDNSYRSDGTGAELVQCSDSRSQGEYFEDCLEGLMMIEGRNITVDGAETLSCDIGITIKSSEDCRVQGSVGQSDAVSCSVQMSSGIVLEDNLWSGCGIGAQLLQDSGSSVRSDRAELCSVGVYLEGCDGTALEQNRFEACQTGVYANHSDSFSMAGDRHGNASAAVRIAGGGNGTVSACTIEYCSVGLVAEDSGNNSISTCDISNCSEEAIIIRGGSGNDVSANSVHDTSRGLLLHSTQGNNLSDNRLRNIHEYAIMLNATEGDRLQGNNVTECFLGIVLLASERNLIIGNRAERCYDGMLLRGSNGNLIIANHQLWSSDYGIALFDSDENQLRQNNLSFSSNYGLGLFDSDRNLMASNDFMENAGPAVLIQSGQANELYDNAFFGNNGASATYLESHLQAFDAGSATIWHASNGTRSFGNFWSDWMAPDADFDSIVDRPYALAGPVGAADIYPLTSPNLAPPSAPLALEGLGRNASVRLVWSPPAEDGDARVLNYTVYRAVENGTAQTYALLGNVTEFLDGNVTNGANYTYSVSAVNLMGEGPRSAPVRVTPIGVPWAPLNLTANATAQYVLLNWTLPEYLGGSNTTSYQLFRGTSSGNLSWLANVVGLEYNDSEVENGATYYYSVVGVNEAGLGNWSDEVNATVPVVPPFAPEYAQTLLQGAIAIVNWTAPTFDGGAAIEGYHVYRSENGVWTTSPYGFTNASTSTFADQALQFGSSYVYAVAAYNSAGEGPRRETGPVVPMTWPGAPTDLEATMIGTGDDAVVILQWVAPSFDGGAPIIGYVVLRGMSGEPMEEVARVSDTTYSDEEVVDIATYIYAIKAYNQVGEGDVSEEVVAKKTRTVFGRVLNTAGDPVPNATVTIDGRSDTTDSTGLFTLEALPGDRIIQIESDQGSLEEEISIGLDSSYLGDFVVEQEEEPLEFLGLFWMWWLLIIGVCVVVPLVLLLLRRR